MQSKFEGEIENLRSQLKGSQSEQFVRQQQEHRKLIEDNAVLMREVKTLREQLKEEQHKVQDLYEDAQTVREELLRELALIERAKLNQSKRKDVEIIHEEDEGSENLSEGPRDSAKKRKVKNMVSVGISRAESIMSLN